MSFLCILSIYKQEQMFYNMVTHKAHGWMHQIVDNCQKMVYYVGRFINVWVCVLWRKRDGKEKRDSGEKYTLF